MLTRVSVPDNLLYRTDRILAARIEGDIKNPCRVVSKRAALDIE